MIKNILFFLSFTVFISQSSIAEQETYFIITENVTKEYEFLNNTNAKIIEEYYEISKNNFSETFIKTREKNIILGLRTENYLTYKLDPDTKEILLVEQTYGLTGDIDDMTKFPKVILSLPLKVGKKWKYSLIPNKATCQAYEVLGKEPPSLLEYERKVTKKTTINVPAGQFEVYVIKEISLTYGEISGYEYWNNKVGLVATGNYADKKWIWTKRLNSISK